MDLLRRLVRDVLDVDAAFGRKHEGDLADCAIDQRGEIELLVDRRAFLDIEAVDLLAGGAGLDGHQRRPQHLLGEVPDLLDRVGEPHAALVAGRGLLEPALAAAARVDLALDHPERSAELPGRRFRLVGREGRHARSATGGEGAQHRFGLIFVDVHETTTSGKKRTPATRASPGAQAASAGLIALHASIKPCTAATDLANIAFSASSSAISMIRSTPLAPITTGTPT